MGVSSRYNQPEYVSMERKLIGCNYWLHRSMFWLQVSEGERMCVREREIEKKEKSKSEREKRKK